MKCPHLFFTFLYFFMMNEHPILHPGNIYLSDIAVSNANTLYGTGTPTLPALMDLAHIIQAAVLHDTLLVSPIAELDNSLLQQLEGVAKWSFEEKVSENEEYDPNAVPGDELFSTVLTSMTLRFQDPFFGSLLNLSASLDPGSDGGAYAFGKFPLAMLMFQAQHASEGVFEDREARKDFLNRMGPTIERVSAYSASLNALYEVWGVSHLSSVIEQPLVEPHKIAAFGHTEKLDTLYKEIQKRTNQSVESVQGLMIEEYKMPALGLYVLNKAQHLDEIPRITNELREKFSKLRESLILLEGERLQLIQSGEEGYKDLMRLKHNLGIAYEAFAKRIDDGSITKDIRRIERKMDGARWFDSLFGLVTSLGLNALGSVSFIMEQLRYEDRLKMKLVPGLFTAASTMKMMELDTVGGLVSRYLKQPKEQFIFPQLNLKFAFLLMEKTYQGEAFDSSLGISFGEDAFFPARYFWTQMLKEPVIHSILTIGVAE